MAEPLKNAVAKTSDTLQEFGDYLKEEISGAQDRTARTAGATDQHLDDIQRRVDEERQARADQRGGDQRSAGDAAREGLTETKDHVKDTGRELSDRVKDAFHGAQDRTSEAVDSTAQTLRGDKEGSNPLKEGWDKLKDSLADSTAKVQDKAQETADAAQDRMNEAGDRSNVDINDVPPADLTTSTEEMRQQGLA